MSREIPISKGYIVLVDDADFDSMSKWKWTANVKQLASCQSVYAQRKIWLGGGKYKCTTMHREIAGDPVGLIVDHANGDTLDNRRLNLRICDASESVCNRRNGPRGTTGFRGVRQRRRGGLVRYVALISVRGRDIMRGWYSDPRDAAARYDDLAREHHGAFAVLNFPEPVAA